MSEKDGERLVAEKFPDWLDPMLATLVGEPFSDEEWIYERKLDGERCLAYRQGHQVRLMSRNQKNLVDTYPEVADWLEDHVDADVVVDGEIVAFDGAITSFQRLQSRMQVRDPKKARSSDVAVFYYLFDILHHEGSSTRDLPLRERKRMLRDGFDFSDPVRFTPHRNTEGEDFYDEACADGWEGLIAKDATSTYVGTRSRKWLKFKCVSRQEFVIGGYTDPEGERSGFGALLIGYYEDDDLVYAGKVGTGYDEETLDRLGRELRRRETDETPFRRNDSPDAHWVEPELVAEIGFSEWTSGGRLRHPRYIGLREDKPAKEVVKETAL